MPLQDSKGNVRRYWTCYTRRSLRELTTQTWMWLSTPDTMTFVFSLKASMLTSGSLVLLFFGWEYPSSGSHWALWLHSFFTQGSHPGNIFRDHHASHHPTFHHQFLQPGISTYNSNHDIIDLSLLYLCHRNLHTMREAGYAILGPRAWNMESGTEQGTW